MMGSNKRWRIYIPCGEVLHMNLNFKMPEEAVMGKVLYIGIYIYIHLCLVYIIYRYFHICT